MILKKKGPLRTWHPYSTTNAVEICRDCDVRLHKSIDIRMGRCEACGRLGCEDYVSTDFGTGHCVEGGCSAHSQQRPVKRKGR